MDDWDWELLHDSQHITQPTRISSSSSSVDVADSGAIHANYFSIDSHQHNCADVEEPDEDEQVSDNPSWIDPSSSHVASRRERVRTSSCTNSDSSDLLLDPHSDCGAAVVDDLTEDKTSEFVDDSNTSGGSKVTEEVKSGADNEKKRVVWWRVPLEVLRYCVMRVSPVWSLSMAAAAIMGYVIMRRRYLYRMKRKTQGLQLKVIVDDKKVSQFMSRAARLNEAFSVVKRVPIIRPLLPAPGLAPWPVASEGRPLRRRSSFNSQDLGRVRCSSAYTCSPPVPCFSEVNENFSLVATRGGDPLRELNL